MRTRTIRTSIFLIICAFIMLTISLGVVVTKEIIKKRKDLPLSKEISREDKDTRFKEPLLSPEYAEDEIVIKFKSQEKLEELTSKMIKDGRIKDVGKIRPEISIKIKQQILKEDLTLKGTAIIEELPEKIKYLVKDNTYMKPVFVNLHNKIRSQKKTENQIMQERFNVLLQDRKMPFQQAKVFNLSNCYILKNIDTKNKSIRQICDEVSKDINVEYAEPNYIYKLNTLPNDYYYMREDSWGQGYDDLWGIKKIDCESAWDISRGEGIVVAVIDTGVDYTHPDIMDNMWDDGRGNCGYDFVNNDNNPEDNIGHGTHVAGIIAATGDNEIGIIGVAPLAEIMAVKGFDSDGGGTAEILVQCIDYAVDNNADILNCSWGGIAESELINDAIENAYNQGCIIVAAVGNDNIDYIYHPASSKYTIAIASTDNNDLPSFFSNYGFFLDVSAPGGSLDWVLIQNSLCSGNYYAKSIGDKVPYLDFVFSGLYDEKYNKVTLYLNKGPNGSTIEYYYTCRDYPGVEDGRGSINTYSPHREYHIEHEISFSKGYPNISLELYTNSGQNEETISFDCLKIGAYVIEETDYFLYTDTVRSNLILLDSEHTGQDILSLRANDTDMYMDGKCIVGDEYYRLSGTSMATPFVSGLAALMLSYKPELSTEEVRQILRTSSDSPEGQGFNKYYGYGRINAYNALQIDSVCIARIDYPKNYSFINNSCEIKGTATGDNFRSYKLEYGEGEYPDYFTTIAESNTQVFDDILFSSIDLETIPVGNYTLKLVVEDISGNTYEDRIHVRINDPVLENGWLFDTKDRTRLSRSSTLADINGDSYMEVIAIFDNSGAAAYVGGEGNAMIYVLNHEGELLDGWPVAIPEVYGTSPAIGDINNDGTLELFCATYEGIYAFDSEGNPLGGWDPKTTGIDTNFSFISLADVNNDNYLEVIALTVGRGEYPSRLYVWDRNGNIPNDNFPINLGESSKALHTAIGQFDSERNTLEIVVPVYYSDGEITQIQVYNHSGDVIFISEISNGMDIGIPFACIGDMDNDGLSEIVYSSLCNEYDNILTIVGVLDNSGTRIAEWSDPNWLSGGPSLGNLDNNNDLEIIVSTVLDIHRTKYFILDYNGTELCNIDINEYVGPPILVDVDGNNDTEIVSSISSGRSDVFTTGTKLYAFYNCQNSGTQVTGWPLDLFNWPIIEGGATCSSTPAIRDIDNDNKLELVVSPGYGLLYLTEISDSISPTTLDWPMEYHDIHRTNNYNYKVPSRSLIPTVIDEGVFTSYRTRLSADWFLMEPIPDNVEYRYLITEESPDGHIIRPWTYVGTDTSTTATGLSLEIGKTYFFGVQARVDTGNWCTPGYSDGIIVVTDATLPTTPVVTDEGDYTTSLTRLSANWTSSEDPESGIAEYHYAIGISEGSTDIVPWTYIGLNTSVVRNDLNLINGRTYFVNVKAKNGEGVWSELGSSDGIRVDMTPPRITGIRDEGDYTSSNTTLMAEWYSEDGQSPIVEHKYAVGTSRGGNDTKDWTYPEPKTATSTTINGLSLVGGQTYYISVKAMNAVGLWSNVASSDGITVNISTLPTPIVIDEGDYKTDDASITATWHLPQESESGVVGYEYYIRGDNGTILFDWQMTTSNSGSSGISDLQEGVRYYFNVRSINNAGTKSPIGSSDGITIDTEGPEIINETDPRQSEANIYAKVSDASSGLKDVYVLIRKAGGWKKEIMDYNYATDTYEEPISTRPKQKLIVYKIGAIDNAGNVYETRIYYLWLK